MHGFRRERHVIPERVVCGGRLRKPTIGFHFYRMDQIGKLDGILDEENRDIVADQIPVPSLYKTLRQTRARRAVCRFLIAIPKVPKNWRYQVTLLRPYSSGFSIYRLALLRYSSHSSKPSAYLWSQTKPFSPHPQRLFPNRRFSAIFTPLVTYGIVSQVSSPLLQVQPSKLGLSFDTGALGLFFVHEDRMKIVIRGLHTSRYLVPVSIRAQM